MVTPRKREITRKAALGVGRLITPYERKLTRELRRYKTFVQTIATLDPQVSDGLVRAILEDLIHKARALSESGLVL